MTVEGQEYDQIQQSSRYKPLTKHTFSIISLSPLFPIFPHSTIETVVQLIIQNIIEHNMGQSNNNPFKQGGQLMSQYKIDDKNAELSITYLTHKKTQKQFILREQTFTDLRDFALNLQKLKKRKTLGCPYLTNLIRFQERSQDHLCSNFYKIYTLWEYPNKTLGEEINQRALQKKRFQAKEIWSILACVFVALSTLQEQDIKHQCLTTKSILTDDQGNVKVVDPLAFVFVPNIDSVYNNRNIKHVYLSPEQCQSIETQKPIINKNSYKNDVFVLGMIVLECGLLERQDQCYVNDCSEVNFDRIQGKLKRFGEIYGEELRKMVELMLARDIRNRPDWKQLNTCVNENSKNAQAVNTQRSSQRQHFITRIGNNDADTKRAGSLVQAGPVKTVQQPRSMFYKEPTQVLPSGYIVPVTSYTPPQSQPQLQFQTQTQNPPSSYINKQYSSKPVETKTYSQPSNPFTVTFSNSQHFSSLQPQSYFVPPTVTQTNPPLNPPLSGLSQKFNPQFTSFFNKDNFSSSFLTFPSQNIPKNDENKQSIASNITAILDQKIAYPLDNSSPNMNEYIRPTQSVNYEIPKMQSPPENNYDTKYFGTNPFDPKLTRTPEIGDHSQLELQPTFVEEHFKMGSRYEGYKLDGMRHGKGKFFYQDGGSYDGQWSQNKMQGYGILYYQSNIKAYEGNWVDDKFQGFGKLYNEQPASLNEDFDYRNFDEIDEYWAFYEGNFSKDLKDGKGKLQFSNGEVFEGTFKEDMVEGEGVFYRRNRERIHGIWHENRLEQILS